VEVIPPRVLVEGTPTRMDMEILRQVEWTIGMRDMVCCLGWRELFLLGLSFIGSLDGFDVWLAGNASFALFFLQMLGAVVSLLRKLYIEMGVCGILVFDE
jgi:hypothetical protein